MPHGGDVKALPHLFPEFFLRELRFLLRCQGIGEGLFMDQIDLGLREGLILCRIHYALSKIPKLRVKSSICLNINKSIEIITLRHTSTSPIGSEHSQALNESVATRIAKVRRKVIGVYSVFLLDVVFRERGLLFLTQEVGVKLDPALREQLIR